MHNYPQGIIGLDHGLGSLIGVNDYIPFKTGLSFIPLATRTLAMGPELRWTVALRCRVPVGRYLGR